MPTPLRKPLRMAPAFESLVGQTITRIDFSDALGLRPELRPGDIAEWMGMDERVGAGINALAAAYDPLEDEEPFDVTLAVYEPFRTLDGRSIDRHTLLVLELAADAENPRLLRVVGADAPAALQEMALREALAEIRRVLAPWPLERRQARRRFDD
jgi:hypothetical protein